MSHKYKLVAVGGTFDRFHAGHQSLLKTAFENGERVIIGLTTSEMIRSKTLFPIIDNYEKRYQAVSEFITKENYAERAEIVPLKDPYGPLKRRPDIEAIVVGPRFTKEAVDVLKKHIDIIHCPIMYTDRGNYLSSTSIRLGHVGRDGRVYRFPNNKIVLSDKVRSYLKNPLGDVYKNIPDLLKKTLLLVSVGDETTRLLASKGMFPDLAIVDLFVQREKKYTSLKDLGISEKYNVTTVRNLAGTLTPALARAVKQGIKRVLAKQKEVIQVMGEEDLATLLCILFAPLTSLVCYGQPNTGLVVVEVTEKKKKEVVMLLSQFTP